MTSERRGSSLPIVNITIIDSANPAGHYHVLGVAEWKTTDQNVGPNLHSIPSHVAVEAGVVVSLAHRPQQAVSRILHSEGEAQYPGATQDSPLII